MATGSDARSPELLMIDRNSAGAGENARVLMVRQIIADPEEHYDFAIVATVDLAASDAAAEVVLRTTSFGSARLAS